MQDENVAERLKRFIESEGLSYSQFADSCGIPRPSLSQLLTGRNKKINDTMVRQIHNRFPMLSVVWLLFGEGDMLSKEVSESGNSVERIEETVVFDSDNRRRFGSSVLEGLKNSKSPYQDEGSDKIQKEKGFNSVGRQDYPSDNEKERLLLRIKELTNQIEKMRANPRKVTQITLYYDDSTFETFERIGKGTK